MEGGLENPKKELKLGEDSLCKTSFQLGMGLKKGQKQGRDERTQEDYPTSAVYFFQMLGSLLAFFHLCLVSVLSPGSPLTEMKFYRNFFPLHVVMYAVCVWKLMIDIMNCLLLL